MSSLLTFLGCVTATDPRNKAIINDLILDLMQSASNFLEHLPGFYIAEKKENNLLILRQLLPVWSLQIQLLNLNNHPSFSTLGVIV